jgi:hypothetical protein
LASRAERGLPIRLERSILRCVLPFSPSPVAFCRRLSPEQSHGFTLSK